MRKDDLPIITIVLENHDYYDHINVAVYGESYRDFEVKFGTYKEELIRVLEEITHYLKEYGYPYYHSYPYGG